MCDHVYLFDNDYEDAKDIYGKPMHGRFPYDERGRIILEVHISFHVYIIKFFSLLKFISFVFLLIIDGKNYTNLVLGHDFCI